MRPPKTYSILFQLYVSVLELFMSKFEQKKIFLISIIKYTVPRIQLSPVQHPSTGRGIHKL
jgi:hypothetical protein